MKRENVAAIAVLESSFQIWVFANVIGSYVSHLEKFESFTGGVVNWMHILEETLLIVNIYIYIYQYIDYWCMIHSPGINRSITQYLHFVAI